MGQIMSKVDNGKIIVLIAILSKYDFFHISVDNGTGFNCTGITCDDFGCIEFQRLFATPVYSDRVTAVEAISPKQFVCTTNRKTYSIVPLHEKPYELPIREKKNWKQVLDLLNVNYFGKRFTTYVKELDIIVLVVDPNLLGELTKKEQYQIQRIIDVELHGLSQSMQMCRTVCFQVKIHDGRRRIYAGMYDLERGQSVSSKIIYDERNAKHISAELHNAVKDVYSYAQSEYNNLKHCMQIAKD